MFCSEYSKNIKPSTLGMIRTSMIAPWYKKTKENIYDEIFKLGQLPRMISFSLDISFLKL